MIVKAVGTGLSLPGALYSLNSIVLSSVNQILLLVWSPRWLPTLIYMILTASALVIVFQSLCLLTQNLGREILIHSTSQAMDRLLGISCLLCLNQLWLKFHNHRALIWPLVVSMNGQRHSYEEIWCGSYYWHFNTNNLPVPHFIS